MPPALAMQSPNHWIDREVPEMFSPGWSPHFPAQGTPFSRGLLWFLGTLPHPLPLPLSPPTQVPSTFPPVSLCPSHSCQQSPAVPAFVFCCPPVPPVPQTVLFLKSQLQACRCHCSFPLL